MTPQEREDRLDAVGDQVLELLEDVLAGRKKVALVASTLATASRAGSVTTYALEVEDIPTAPPAERNFDLASTERPAPCDVCGKPGRFFTVDADTSPIEVRPVEMALCDEHASGRAIVDE
jgi:hypothetical protein